MIVSTLPIGRVIAVVSDVAGRAVGADFAKLIGCVGPPASRRRRSHARPASAASAAALSATVLPSCCQVTGRLRPATTRRDSPRRAGSCRSSAAPHLPQNRSSRGLPCWHPGQMRSTIVVLLKARYITHPDAVYTQKPGEHAIGISPAISFPSIAHLAPSGVPNLELECDLWFCTGAHVGLVLPSS